MYDVLRSHFGLFGALALLASDLGAQERPRERAPRPLALSAATVLSGHWTLAPEHSHYGASAAPRRAEEFDCEARLAALRCTIRSEFPDGRHITATFHAPLNGEPGPVTGMPGMDSVRVVTVAPGVADATFSTAGRPVFAYRAYLGRDGSRLTIVAIDPVRRTVLTSVVVYVRAPDPR